MKRPLLNGILLLLFVSGLVLPGFAQTPTPKPQKGDDDVIKVQSRLVVVPVSVLDAKGQPVTGLTKENFQIAEEGRQQVIDQLGNAEKVPLEIALLIDVSGSVNPLFDFEIQTAAQFLKDVMKADDRATIFLIGDKPTSDMVRENSTQAAARILTIKPQGKFTAFYDTVSQASRYLQKNAPEKSRRVILALTDGEDNWSDLTRDAERQTYKDVDVNNLTQEKRNQVAARTDAAHLAAQGKILHDLQNADTVFYSVNPSGDSYKLNKISTRAQSGMQRFADETGGTAFLPKVLSEDYKDARQNPANIAKNRETLVNIFKQLAGELQAQYLIQYYSESDFPLNKFVRVDVGLINKSGLRVRARQGYYVKN